MFSVIVIPRPPPPPPGHEIDSVHHPHSKPDKIFLTCVKNFLHTCVYSLNSVTMLMIGPSTFLEDEEE